MTERLGLIPLSKRVEEISRYYERLENSIVRILLSVQIGSSNAAKTAIASKKIDCLLLAANIYSRDFARKTVPEAYEESARKVLTSLKALDTEKNPRYNQKKHKKTQQEFEREMIGFYVEANQSIKRNSNVYLNLVARTSKKLSSTQFFNFEESMKEIGAMIDIAYEQHKGYKYAERLIRNYLEGYVGEGNLIEINGRHYNIRKYSRLVARTELRRVQTQATKNYCNEYENDLVQWSKHANPCEICAPLEGRIFSLSGKHPNYPPLQEEPPLHPQCVLPQTRCIAPGGLVAGLRVRYNGKIIEFTFSNGSQLSVSQNHLFLTPHGFAAAQLLREGDDVFYCPDFERIIASNPYNNGMPSRIDDIVETLAKSPGMSSCRVPVTSKYLHNDGKFCDGDIDVIRPDGFLGNTSKSTLFKKSQTSLLNSGNSETSLFPGESYLAAMFKSLAFAADSLMGGNRSPSSFFRSRVRRSNSMAFTDAPQGESSSNESHSNGLPGHTELFTNLMKARSSLIDTIKIVGVNIYSFHDYVYDLHTHTSLYLANGILTSNCEHNINPTSESAIKFREKYG